MPPARKGTGQVAQAEASLLQDLKSCLVNLPSSLVSVLENANTVAQNVVIELQWRQTIPPTEKSSSSTPSTVPRSVYVGWTGMPSKRKLAPVIGKDGLSGSRGGAGREQDIALVEINMTFARLVGLSEGQKVGVLLHTNPPEAHTVNVEPLTPADWEIIELHAQFLELNFLSQVRALPNPAYSSAKESDRQSPHPLTLYLSPTSTANIVVKTLTPAPAGESPFAKISPDAEVIVAPKERQRRTSGRGSSVASGARSAEGKSSTSTIRRRNVRRSNDFGNDAVFLRGLDRGLGGEWFDEDEGMDNNGLRVWLDRDILLAKAYRGLTWVCVSLVKPSGLQEHVDPQKAQAEQEQEKPAPKVIARIGRWEDPPDSRHVALSTDLCKVLACEGLLGGLVRVEPAVPPIPKSALKSSTEGLSATSHDGSVKSVKVLPFATLATSSNAIKFGGESKQEQDKAAQKLRDLYGSNIFDGPLTDGMILPDSDQPGLEWAGGILQLNPPSQQPQSSGQPPRWFLPNDRPIPIEIAPEIPPPTAFFKSWTPGEPLPPAPPIMVGIDELIAQLTSHLSHSSSVLLTGGIGAGKSNLSHVLVHRLRSEYLFHSVYFPCRTLLTDETRVSTIKETLNRIFASAAWGARLGGRSVVILDDLDRLCPVETELQVGNDNGRSRHLSETICSIVRQYCGRDSGVVLLATARAKESLNNVIIGGHVVREIVSLKAPNKEGRRKVLERLVYTSQADETNGTDDANGAATNGNSWHDDSPASSRPNSSDGPKGQDDGFTVDPKIDLLELAGQTDGYVPGDLVLLVSRARSEALIRSFSSPDSPDDGPVQLSEADFKSALEGFTPASLRNVTLQSSTTRWDSIGGLTTTRRMLLETLQYPTTYAPIFAQCPLRLRSGLLLYGYPGCGKTLLASAVAGECGLNFISVKGPEILNKYIGASEKSVRDLFERAEAARPCVLFFDEFDSIAPKRGHDSTGVTDRVVNQMLTQMDGAEGLSGVYVLAATSRPDLIDPALLRPGRLDKSIICDMPSMEERIDILSAVTGKLRMHPSLLSTGDEGENLRDMAKRTEGYSGADLQAVVYNAQLEAIHDVLGDQDLSVSGKGKKGDAVNGTTKPSKNGVPDFTYFRVEDNLDNTPGQPTPSQLTERASIAANLSNLKALRRKQRHLTISQSGQSQQTPHDEDGKENDVEDAGEREPMIHWRHVQSALATTRGSISDQERRRLEGIYREFVSGRNGDLPSGQGGNEVGGRTSLM